MSYQDAIEDTDIIDGLSVKYLKFFGLWKIINDYRTTGKKNAILKLKVLLSFILAVPYICFQCLSYFSIDVDIQKATFLNFNSLSGIQMCGRILVFWIRIDSQCRLVNIMKKNYLFIPKEKQKAVSELFVRISKISNMCCTAYMTVCAILCLLYIVDPGISVDYILYHTGNMDAVTTGRKKIMGGWYPIPMADTPYYEIIFLYEAVCVIVATILLPVYCCLFFQVLFCLYAQFVVFGYHIETFKYDLKNTRHKEKIKISETLCRMLQDHQKLLRYSDELKSVYNPLVTLTFAIGIPVLVMGTIQFLLGKSLSTAFIFKMMKVLFFQGVEVCFLCFGSSLIESASSDLLFSIYCSEWYIVSGNLRKSIHIMMNGAKNGVRLTAVRMYPVNRETLMKILQFIYSSSTLMLKMTE